LAAENLVATKGWKAPTGTVDYDTEDELKAAVREVHEETHIDILPENLKLVGMIPSDKQIGRNPDRNLLFTCISTQQANIQPQEKEIEKVVWLSVHEFLESKLPVNHTSKPLVMQEVVRIAKKSIENNQGWSALPAFWGSGRTAKIYQDTSKPLNG
jgi:ADP-ribose pyrophosphatase YjhB (NUDIX family)